MKTSATSAALALLAFAVLVGSSCSAPDIDGTLWRCSTQSDCGEGFVCAEALGACVEPDNSANGVDASTIVIGMSAPLNGGASSAAAAYRAGVEAHFAEINARGGIDGRQVQLQVVDDSGDPARALTNVQDMVGGGQVFAVMGGNYASADVVDFMVANKTILFAPLSGDAAVYKDPPDRYVFQLRPSAALDASGLTNYALDPQGNATPAGNMGLFAESRGDGLSPEGEVGRAALFGALEAQASASSAEVFTHPQDSVNVDDAVGDSLRWLAAGRTKDDNGEIVATIFLASHVSPSGAFVRELLDELFKIKRGTSGGLEYGLTQEEAEELLNVQRVGFAALSTMDSDQLTTDLKSFGTYQTVSGEEPYCTSVFATRAVPPVDSGSSAVLSYRDALQASNASAQPTHIGLEGYIAARVFVEAMRLNGPAMNTEGVITQLESLELDLGLSAPISFSPSDHVAFDDIQGFRYEGASCANAAIDLSEPDDITPPDPEGCEGGVCILTGTITDDLTLTADKRWLLRGLVFVGNGTNPTTLTIEPGTTILGESETTGSLVVRRGARLVAEGTREAPIVFTSSVATGSRAAGDWGGIIINGRAPINGCDAPPCEAFGEGGTGFFGGDDPEDDSGVLRYVRIEFAGKLLSPENELNGLALQGVGRGTTLEYIQVHRGADDGVEFYGGTVNFKYILTTGIEDDNLDWVLGWQGKGQYFIAQQWPGLGDNGIEADNNEDGRDASPRSKPTLCNLSLIGSPESDASDYGMLLREGTGAVLSSAVVLGWNDACLDIDHAETFANALQNNTELSGELTIERSIFSCATAFVEDDEDGPDPVAVSAFVQDLNADNQLADPVLRAPFDLVNPDYRPASDGSPAANGGGCPDDPFFDDTTFRGGMSPSEDWTLGWTTNVEN